METLRAPTAASAARETTAMMIETRGLTKTFKARGNFVFSLAGATPQSATTRGNSTEMQAPCPAGLASGPGSCFARATTTFMPMPLLRVGRP